ncbi:hypothetical protein IKQ38_00700 [Candidatus Saccharibacteria bacterium]|nr:hypothetical protein [Candidatus Saccharibacteria bacterium]
MTAEQKAYEIVAFVTSRKSAQISSFAAGQAREDVASILRSAFRNGWHKNSTIENMIKNMGNSIIRYGDGDSTYRVAAFQISLEIYEAIRDPLWFYL